jgi:O-antigen ligase
MRAAHRVDMSAFVVAAGAVGLIASDQGGFFMRTWPWAGVCLGAVGAIVLLSTLELRVQPAGLVLITGTVAISGWTALSWFWSSEPSTSLDEALRAPVYVAAAVAFVALAAAGGSRGLLLGVSASTTALAVYSLVDRLLTGSTPALLAGPLGYANALGALCGIGLVVAGTLGVAVRRKPGPAAAAATSAIVLVVALALTGSRGSWLALAAGIGVTAAARGGRRWAAGALAAVAVLEGGLLTLTAFGTPSQLQARGDYWHVAWHVAWQHPLAGMGAGTFDLAWAAYGDLGRWGGVADAHSLYLETFAELGLVGLVLLGGFLAPAAAAALRSSLSVTETAALGGAVAFLVHAGLDFDWEMPAVTVAGIACLAATLGVNDAQPAGPTLRSTLIGVEAATILGYLLYLVLHRI